MVAIEGIRRYIPNGEDTAAAQQVSSWIRGHGGEMVSRSPDEIMERFGQRRSMLIQVLVGGEWQNAAHAAITHRYEDGSAELGAVVSNPQFRGKGQGTLLAARAMEELMASDLVEEFASVFAMVLLANIKSMELFEGLPFAERIDSYTLPEAAFGEVINGEVAGPDEFAAFRMRRLRRVASMQLIPPPASQIVT